MARSLHHFKTTATKVQTSTFSIPDWSSSTEFRIAGYHNIGQFWYAGS